MGRGILGVRPIVICCLAISGFITISWYVKHHSPRMYIGSVEVVNHNRTPNAGITTVQEPAIDPVITRETSGNNQEKLGYLVIRTINEQLTSAMTNFLQLYMINELHWKLGMIEPYVTGTHLSVAPSVTEDFRSLPLLSTYFNRSHMMHSLSECFHSDVKLNTFQDFLINAARPFIMLSFVTGKTVPKGISECSFSMNGTETLFNYHLQSVKDEAMAVHGLNHQFVGVYSLCIRAQPQKPFSMLQVVNYVRQWMMNSSNQSSGPFTPKYTVVVREWRIIKNEPNNHYFYDPSFTTLNFTDTCHLRSIPHTSFVINTASRVLNTSALPRPLIAFHVRSEKIALTERKDHVRGFVNKCMALLPRVLEAVQRKYNVSRNHMIFVHDGAEYGSGTMNAYNSKPLSTSIVSKVKALGIRNVQYKPLHNTRVDITAPPFVEAEILMSADVLVLVGMGSFQKTILERFTHKVKGGDKWYKVCSRTPQEDHLQGLDL